MKKTLVVALVAIAAPLAAQAPRMDTGLWADTAMSGHERSGASAACRDVRDLSGIELPKRPECIDDCRLVDGRVDGAPPRLCWMATRRPAAFARL